ncbi:glutamine amidotransferase class 2 [uncultured archaeal virus]|jgi:predicted glutamine amidotransferase|uniref:glutamine--fructose-6-phosphate transaminase (isomerizing) n=1 Tax=uncultured archaeal virus TaxID=1960247 RepID=A0A1S5Y323_9VIRU|nr:glutamine amidotransferase class 2 [uncultured archaeal virus]
MCGIGAYIGFNAIKKVVKILKNQENRGKKGAGVAYLDNGEIKVIKAPISPTKFEKQFKNQIAQLEHVTIAIGHNRMPTRGAQTVENTHPFLAYSGDFALVHNGSFEVEQFALLLKYGDIELEGNCDSEYFTRALELYTRKFENVEKALESLLDDVLEIEYNEYEYTRYYYSRNSYAIIVLTKDGKLILARNSNPCFIVVGKNKGEILVASEIDGAGAILDDEVTIYEFQSYTMVTIDIFTRTIVGAIKEVYPQTKKKKVKRKFKQQTTKRDNVPEILKCKNCVNWERRSKKKGYCLSKKKRTKHNYYCEQFISELTFETYDDVMREQKAMSEKRCGDCDYFEFIDYNGLGECAKLGENVYDTDFICSAFRERQDDEKGDFKELFSGAQYASCFNCAFRSENYCIVDNTLIYDIKTHNCNMITWRSEKICINCACFVFLNNNSLNGFCDLREIPKHSLSTACSEFRKRTKY